MVLFFGAVSTTLYYCIARAASLLGRGGVRGEGTSRVGSLSSHKVACQTLKPETPQTVHLFDTDCIVKVELSVSSFREVIILLDYPLKTKLT